MACKRILRCKKLLSISLIRISFLKSRREVQVAQLRRDIAQLLHSGRERSARLRLPRLWKEQNLLFAYDIIEQYCEMVISIFCDYPGRRPCPVDLIEPLSNLVFATSRCGDLPELQDFRSILSLKYGKEFITAVQQQRPECHLNEAMVECFDSRGPSEAVKQELLENIATEYNFPPEFLNRASIGAHQGLPSSPSPENEEETTSEAEEQGMLANSQSGSQENVFPNALSSSKTDFSTNYLLINYAGRMFVARETHRIGAVVL